MRRRMAPIMAILDIAPPGCGQPVPAGRGSEPGALGRAGPRPAWPARLSYQSDSFGSKTLGFLFLGVVDDFRVVPRPSPCSSNPPSPAKCSREEIEQKDENGEAL